MKTAAIFAGALAGTTLMTAFSYLLTELDGENYSEPERLGQLAHNLLPMLRKEDRQVVGWTAHYLVGLIFSLTYIELWHKKKLRCAFGANLLLGGLSGLIAVAVWKTIFRLHPLPPTLSFNKYYLQLIPAHMVFALFAGIGYRLLDTPSD